MRKKVRISCIVQARTGSTRLPNKVLLKVVGKEILIHVIERLLRSKKIDDIIIVTTTEERDNPIVELVKKINSSKVKYYRGSETDVLDRYYQAAKNNKSDIIVRITSDCPLIDWEVVDENINYLIKGNFDYVSNALTKRTFPLGLDTEVFNFNTLKLLWEKSKEEREREHVTLYLIEHTDEFNTKNVENKTFINPTPLTKNKYDLSNLRWTLDEKDDFIFINEIYEKLYENNNYFKTEDILELIRKDNELININAHIEPKKV